MENSIVFIYNSFNDPLFKGNLFQHLIMESRNNRFKFIILSFEQKEYQLNKKEEEKIKEDLLALNMAWFPLRWHSGRFIIFKKLYDGINALLLVLKLHFKFKPKVIISLGTIAGSFSYILKTIFSYKHFAYQHEPHSEFMKDFDIWKPNSLSYRLLKHFENKTANSAEVISTGTDFMVERLIKEGVKGSVFKLPSCANDNLFIIDNNKRIEIRNQLRISDEQKVFIYVGKFGGIYYETEVFEIISELNSLIEEFYIIILSPNDPNWIKSMLNKINVTQFHINQVPYEKVSDYLNASDMGVCAIPGFPSQKFRSPIKVGEYLLCGLPYITNKGVSEDDLIAEKFNVGVVLKEFSKSEIKNSISLIIKILNNIDKTHLRGIGLDYRGLSIKQPILYKIFDKLYNEN